MDKIVNALGKLEDVRLCAEQLRESLPEASKNRERANDIEEVFRVFSHTLRPYLEGASTMSMKQRERIKEFTKKVENRERLLLSLDISSNAHFANLERALASTENAEEYLVEFTDSRNTSDGAPAADPDLRAVCKLATLLQKGAKGVRSDPAGAVALYTRAVDDGHVESMNHLAMILEEGAEGVDADHARAVKLSIRAVEKREMFKP